MLHSSLSEIWTTEGEVSIELNVVFMKTVFITQAFSTGIGFIPQVSMFKVGSRLNLEK